MSGSIGSVLIPTDDSDGAIAGAKIGIALASKVGATLHVLAVVDLPVDASEVDDEAALSDLQSWASTAVERVATLAGEYDEQLEVTTAETHGTPFQAIREYAHRREIDTIAMGTKGRTGLDRVLLGSVTENVLRTSRTPVLAVPPAANITSIEEASFDRLLLPTDGSEGAEIAAAWAIHLAERLGSMLHTVFSVDTTRFPEHRDPGAIITSLERRGEHALMHVRKRATDADVGVSASLATGRPASVILEYATEHNIDMVVIGTHGRTGIGQWFLGSVTENVVRQADVPVFCVPVSARAP